MITTISTSTFLCLGGGALWDEDTFVISLEEGHYAAYIKMMALKYMTDEDVAVEALIYATLARIC
ncbi:hypothetical protein ACJX0J_031418, partial [Zea mays]